MNYIVKGLITWDMNLVDLIKVCETRRTCQKTYLKISDTAIGTNMTLKHVNISIVRLERNLLN